MFLSKSQEDAVSNFIQADLQSWSEVGPAVFSQYALVLLAKDAPVETLKRDCLSDFPEFLGAKSDSFVDRLFRFLEREGIADSRGRVHHTNKYSRSRSRSPDDYDSEYQNRRSSPQRRDMRYNDRDQNSYSLHNQINRRFDNDDRHLDRRYNSHSNYDDKSRDFGPKKFKVCFEYQKKGFCSRGDSCHFADTHNPSNTPQNRTGMVDHVHPPKKQCIEFKMKGFCHRGDSCYFEHSQEMNQPYRKKICLEYKANGYCSRGESCYFADTHNSSNRTDTVHDRNNQQFRKKVCFEYQKNGHCSRGDSCYYADSHNSENRSPNTNGDANIEEGEMKDDIRQYGFIDRGGYANRGARGGYNNVNTRIHRPVPSTSLVVDKIPEEFCNQDAIRNHFSKFGNLISVQILSDENRAYLEYDSLDSAKECHSSPEVIFNNRFVKVYWKPLGDPSHKPMAPDEVREAHLERLHAKQMLRIEQQRKIAELQKSRAILISKQLAEQENVMEKLRDPDLKLEDKRLLMKGLDFLQSSIKQLMMEAAATKDALPTSQEIIQYPKSMKSERKFALETETEQVDVKMEVEQPDESKPASFEIINIDEDCRKLLEDHYSKFSGFESTELKDHKLIIKFKSRREAEAGITKPPRGKIYQINWCEL